MAEILQYTLSKTDSNPWLFSESPVPEKYTAGQTALQGLMQQLENLVDSIDIGDSQVVFVKRCESKAEVNQFILQLGTLQINNQFALDQADEYHDLSFDTQITQA